MPPIDIYKDPNSITRNTIRQTFLGEMTSRAEWYDQIRIYYNGDHPGSLDKKDNEIDDNAVINIIKQATDRTVGFLLSEMPRLEIDPNVSEETDDEKWLRKMWEANGGIQYLQELAYIGCFAGHNYVRIMPPDTTQGDVYPQLVGLDPKAVQTWWKSDDMRRIIFHEVRWSVIGDVFTIDYIMDFVNRGKQWTIYTYSAGSGSNTWKLIDTQEWKLPVPPIVQWKHLPNPRSFYGAGEFTVSQLRLNDAINNIASENNRIIRYHASPKTIGTGLNADGLTQTSIDGLWVIESSDAQIYNLEMKSDLTASMSHMHTLVKALLAEVRVVILEGTVKDFQRVTNAGVRTVFIDMLSKLVVLRWNYGKAIQQISQVAAALDKRGLDIVPDVVYADPLPTDETEIVNVLLLERQMQIVSHQTASNKRGYVWTEELKKMEAEQTNPLFAPPIKPTTPGASGSANPNPSAGLQNEPGSTSNK